MLPSDPKSRKDIPLARGAIDYFPDALCAVAELSRIGNDQHNPGQPLHWAKEKSSDHADCIVRHLIDRGRIDTDGVRHSTKVAWRALALLQIEIEADVDEMPHTPTSAELFDVFAPTTSTLLHKSVPDDVDTKDALRRGIAQGTVGYEEVQLSSGRVVLMPNPEDVVELMERRIHARDARDIGSGA